MPSRYWRASGNALLPGKSVLGPASGGGSTTTWSSGISSTKYTISPGTVATVNAANASLENVKAGTARTSGSYACTPTNLGAGTSVIGIAASSADATINDWPGDYNLSASYQANGSIWLGSGGTATLQGTVATYTNSDVITPVVVSSKLCFKKNGTDVYGNSTTGVGGIDVSTWGSLRPVCAASASGAVFTADFTSWP
jgi:hypothetical protein